MPVFSLPLAFTGFIGLFVAMAIYLFRNRSRKVTVSTLFLWVDQCKPAEGGLFLQGPQAPWLLLLELLILALLVMAAAGPRAILGSGRIPLVVILDASFSMSAGEPDSPRQQAATALLQELAREPRYQTRLILAGARPEFLGPVAKTRQEAEVLLRGWTCRAATADIDQALALANNTGGSPPRILILTDHSPADPGSVEQRIQWWSFGSPRPNMAVIAASRSEYLEQQQVFFEIANFTGKSSSVKTTVTCADLPAQELAIDISAGGTARRTVEVPQTDGQVTIILPPDDLPFDDRVVLFPAQTAKIKVALSLDATSLLHHQIQQALTATDMVEFVAETRQPSADSGADLPDLLITSQKMASAPASVQQWVLECREETDAVACLGPFVLDRNHPLTETLTLDGAIWGVAASGTSIGLPVILIGDLPVLSDLALTRGGHRLVLRVNPGRSNVAQLPDWPILFWNLCRWRRSFLPGPEVINLRLAMPARIRLPMASSGARVRDPEGVVREYQAINGDLVFQPDKPGPYHVSAGHASWSLALNALAAQESDLRLAASGRWGDWHESPQFQKESTDLRWAFLLPALLLSSLHMYLVSYRREGARV